MPGLALEEGRRIAFGGVGRQGGQHMQQFADAGTGLGRGKQHGNQVTFAQRLFEGRMQLAGGRVLAFFEIALHQGFVFFDQLVDKFAVGVGDAIDIRVAGIVFQHLDDVLVVVRRQVEELAGRAETLADIGHQAGQIDVIGVDLVDDDHACQAARGGGAHHALGHQLDAGLGIDHDHRGIDARQRGHGLAGEIRIARGVDEMHMHVFARRNSPAPIAANGRQPFPAHRSRRRCCPSRRCRRPAIAPARCNSASASVVLPAPPCPTRATARMDAVWNFGMVFSLFYLAFSFNAFIQP